MPDKNVVVALINRNLITKEASTMLEEFAMLGAFPWAGLINHPFQSPVDNIYVNVVMKYQAW